MSLIEDESAEQTEFQSKLTSNRESALKKYLDISVGDGRLRSLIRYELAVWLLAPMPGGLGFFLRSRLYPKLLRSCGRSLIAGRSICLRHPGRISVGSNVIIDDNCVLDAKGKSDDGITIGDSVVLGRNSIVSCKGGSISIGHRSNISANCMLISESKIEIGENVLVAGMSYIVAGGNHVTERVDVPIIRQPMLQRGGVIIHDNCWLGANVTILDGVTIGRDSIIAAGAVVTRDVPEFTVAGGIPATIIKSRNQEKGIGGCPR